MPDNILTLKLHIRRPTSKIYLPHIFAVDKTLLRCTPRLIPHALLEVALILQHHLFAADLDALTPAGCILSKSGIGIRDRHAGRGCRGLGWGEADVGEGADGFAIRRLAGDFSAVCKNIISHYIPWLTGYDDHCRPPAVVVAEMAEHSFPWCIAFAGSGHGCGERGGNRGCPDFADAVRQVPDVELLFAGP